MCYLECIGLATPLFLTTDQRLGFVVRSAEQKFLHNCTDIVSA